MSSILAIIVLCSIWITGCVVAILLQRRSLFEIIGLGFILGSLFITLTELLLHQYLHIIISQNFVLTLCSVLAIFSILVLFPKRKSVFSKVLNLSHELKNSSTLTKVLVSLLVGIFLNSLLQNYFWPVSDWDALALYDFRGRIVAETGSFVAGIQLGYFFQYPPFTSLLHTTLYVLGFDRVKVWYSFLYISFQIIFYTQLRKHTSQFLSLVGTILLATHPLIIEHSTMAYTNLSYTIFLSLGLLYLLDWFREKSSSVLLLGSILIMGSTWVRLTEPFWIIPICLLLFIFIQSLFKKSWKHFLPVLSGILIIIIGKGIWTRFVALIYAENIAPLSTQTIENIPVVAVLNTSWADSIPLVPMLRPYALALFSKDLTFLFQRVFQVGDYLYVYIFPIIALYILPGVYFAFYDCKEKTTYSRVLWSSIFSYLLLIFLGTFVFSLVDGSWSEIGGSANRMSMFLIPLFIFGIFSSQKLKIWIKKSFK